MLLAVHACRRWQPLATSLGARPPTAGPTAGGPATALIVLSENVASVSCHCDHILENLVTYTPHVYFLQEARVTPSELRGWHARVRGLGYLLHFDADHNLLAFWRRGLNLAPIAARAGQSDLRACHYALQLKTCTPAAS